MKIVIFSDVHGNLSSLEALSKTSDFMTADKKIFLGDAVIGCSRPNECIEFLENTKTECVIGNNDIYVCDHVPAVDLEEFSEVKKQMLKYMSSIVTDQNKQKVMTWKKEIYLKFGNKTLYFTHYAWEKYKGDFNVVDNPKKINFKSRKKMFKNIKADYVFFGHEHSFDNFTDGKQYFYCVGTLGLRNPGYYLVVDIDKDEIEIQEKFVEFDIDYEINLIDKAGYPYEKNKIKS